MAARRILVVAASLALGCCLIVAVAGAAVVSGAGQGGIFRVSLNATRGSTTWIPRSPRRRPPGRCSIRPARG
jgi:hypothetical protein